MEGVIDRPKKMAAMSRPVADILDRSRPSFGSLVLGKARILPLAVCIKRAASFSLRFARGESAARFGKYAANRG
jgi:hypothetical protein